MDFIKLEVRNTQHLSEVELLPYILRITPSFIYTTPTIRRKIDIQESKDRGSNRLDLLLGYRTKSGSCNLYIRCPYLLYLLWYSFFD